MTAPSMVRVYPCREERTAQARCDCGWSGIPRRALSLRDDSWPDAIARAETDAIKHGRQEGHVSAQPLTLGAA